MDVKEGNTRPIQDTKKSYDLFRVWIKHYSFMIILSSISGILLSTIVLGKWEGYQMLRETAMLQRAILDVESIIHETEDKIQTIAGPKDVINMAKKIGMWRTPPDNYRFFSSFIPQTDRR